MDFNNLKDKALKEEIPIIEDEVLEFLNNFVSANNITSLLEIGSGIGYSAIGLVLSKSDLMISTIERNQTRFMAAEKNIKDFKLEKRIELILGDALKISLDKVYQLIFIDGAKAQSLAFINKYYNNLLTGGYIIVDNLNFHGLVERYPNISNRNTRQLVGKIIRFKNEIVLDERFSTIINKDLGDGLVVLTKLWR